MPQPMRDKTNDELMAIIELGSTEFLFASAVFEMKARIEDANVGSLKELPSQSPPA